LVKKTPQRIKNWTARTPAIENIGIIKSALKEHGVTAIKLEKDGKKRYVGISFSLEINNELIDFKLPVHIERVEELVRESYEYVKLTDNLRDQAYRTSWANVKDWIVAQLALVDSQMAKTEEVFLPYLLTEAGQTYFEVFENHRALLPAPKIGTVIVSEWKEERE
jgi:hypothetical protein